MPPRRCSRLPTHSTEQAVGQAIPFGIDWPERDKAAVGQAIPFGIDWPERKKSYGWPSDPVWVRLDRATESHLPSKARKPVTTQPFSGPLGRASVEAVTPVWS